MKKIQRMVDEICDELHSAKDYAENEVVEQLHAKEFRSCNQLIPRALALFFSFHSSILKLQS